MTCVVIYLHAYKHACLNPLRLFIFFDTFTERLHVCICVLMYVHASKPACLNPLHVHFFSWTRSQSAAMVGDKILPLCVCVFIYINK